MKVLVTGATGFVGRWLIRDLEAAGHAPVGTPSSADLDITDAAAVASFVASVHPDAIAHLAGVSYGPDARRDPEHALAVNEGGTRSVMLAAVASAGHLPVLVVSSSDVYGDPAPADLPLSESAPLLADRPYGLSKLAQERVAFEIGAASGVPIVVARAFNHIGPGQRPDFVVPALAARIVEAARTGSRTITAGNVDVLRDFSDVRDIVRAYRLLLEALGKGRLPADPTVFNIASGRAVAIRRVVEILGVAAEIEIAIEVDRSLVRANDPFEIRGDSSRIAAALGWYPTISLETTLRDVLAEARALDGPALSGWA